MKTNRQKKARKTLAFYINNFKFRQPFQILIDGTFAFAALESKFNIQEQIGKYFQSEVKLLTTACIILETEKLGSYSSGVSGAMWIVKQYNIHKCGHEKQPVTGANCLSSMVGKNNPSRYIIATQDRELQDSLRKIPGAPIMYLHGNTPTLEPPTQISREYAENMQKNLGISTWEKENVKTLKKVAGLVEEKIKPKKKKKKSGPNPLSCLKKKKKPESAITQKSAKSGKVRKKKKVKIASHVKDILMADIARKQVKSNGGDKTNL